MTNSSTLSEDSAAPVYRADIDGLRAVAVLSVIGFHAFPGWLRGGFTGVDIFFVISGYLISTIIFNNLERGGFSFTHFYARRFRRIFPALILVLSACYAFGWFVLMAGEFQSLGKHIAGGAGFIANIILMSEGGYFDVEAISKPLLHLWSLGIEEQFYLSWPLLLWGAWKLRLNLFKVTLAVAAASFAWNIWLFSAQPESAATFYSPQVRFWELLAGSLLAYAKLHPNHRFARYSSMPGCNAQVCLGATFIAFSVLCIHRGHFPDFAALVPTLGAVLVISAGAHSSLNHAVLAHPTLVRIGLISYPLYLWHWPLLSFAYIVEGGEPAAGMRIACVTVAFLLAWLTYLCIERPVRSGSHFTLKTVALVFLMTLTGGAGLFTFQHEGLPFRDFAVRTRPLAESMADWKYPGDLTVQPVDGLDTAEANGVFTAAGTSPRILFLGDSHIAQFGPRIARLSREKHIPVMLLTGYGCLMMPHVFRSGYPHCHILMEYFNRILSGPTSIKTLVLGGNWDSYFLTNQDYYYRRGSVEHSLLTPQGRVLALASYRDFLHSLAKRFTVYLLLDNPELDAFNPAYMLKHRLAFSNIDSLPRTVGVPADQIGVNNAMRATGIAAGVNVIDQLPSLCPGGECRIFNTSEGTVYKDSDHLTARFVTEDAAYIDEVFSTTK